MKQSADVVQTQRTTEYIHRFSFFRLAILCSQQKQNRARFVNMALPSKRRIKFGKNKKKSWKHCDVNDVEEFLEEKRFEERIG